MKLLKVNLEFSYFTDNENLAAQDRVLMFNLLQCKSDYNQMLGLDLGNLGDFNF